MGCCTSQEAASGGQADASRSLMTLPSRWFRAADKGVVSEGEKLLEEVRSNRGRLDVDLEDDDLHWTALGHAVIRGHHDYVRWLINRGASVRKCEHDIKSRPLWWACGEGHVEVVRVLIDAGADINEAFVDSGSTALHWAVHSGRTAVVKFLLERGANRSLRDKEGRTPLDLARQKKLTAIADLLAALPSTSSLPELSTSRAAA